MKWRVRKPNARNRALHMWHKWFAWHPVRVPTRGKMSGMTMIWLQTVERKGEQYNCFSGYGWHWSYRPIETGERILTQ